MNTPFFSRQFLLLVALVFLLSSCAAERTYREGIALSEQGRIEEGLDKIQQASDASPANPEYKIAAANRRLNAINTLLLSADDRLNAGQLADAEGQYSRVLKLDKNNVRATTGLNLVTRARQHVELMAVAATELEAGDGAAVAEKVRAVLLENPRQREALSLLKKIEEKQSVNKFTPPALRPYSNPVTLEFRDAPVKMVFDVLSTTTGVNFILDKDLRPEQRVSIFAKQVTFDRALNLLLDSNQLDKKIINENTLVVYPRTPQKSKEYEELMVKTFYLTNADPKQTANMLKTILKVRDVYVDDRLNMVIMRDTPDIISQAEKLITAQDLPDAEVLLEVTVVEVKHSRVLDLGIQWPTQFGTLNPNGVGPITLDSLRRLNKDSITAGSLPSASANDQISDLNILANPRIRVRNREKAKIHVGDRVPVITTTTPTTVGAASSETVTYVDIGIKLEVEPNIYLEGDVAIKVSLEVSSLGSSITTKSGSVVYQIGTRNASTLLRLKDGETQLLAGLINDEDRTSINGLPGLSELPLIGRLFSSHRDDRQKTEVVLSITPHIVRNLLQPNASVTQFWSGTEQGGQGIYNGGGFATPNWRAPPGMPGSQPGMLPPGMPGGPPGMFPQGMPPGTPSFGVPSPPMPHMPGMPIPQPGGDEVDG